MFNLKCCKVGIPFENFNFIHWIWCITICMDYVVWNQILHLSKLNIYPVQNDDTDWLFMFSLLYIRRLSFHSNTKRFYSGLKSVLIWVGCIMRTEHVISCIYLQYFGFKRLVWICFGRHVEFLHEDLFILKHCCENWAKAIMKYCETKWLQCFYANQSNSLIRIRWGLSVAQIIQDIWPEIWPVCCTAAEWAAHHICPAGSEADVWAGRRTRPALVWLCCTHTPVQPE